MKLTSLVAPSLLAVAALSFLAVGCAAESSPVEPSAEETPTEALEDNLSSRALAYVGQFAWQGGGAAFTDFESVTFSSDGTYEAKVDSSLVNPNVRCVRFPCTLAEKGKWNAFKAASGTRILVRPSGSKPWRYYGADRSQAGLTLTRNGQTTFLADVGPHVLPPTGCLATLCAPGTQCVETTTGPRCMAPCVKTGCSGQICADQSRISTCEFRPEYACYASATCARQADGACGWTQTPELVTCLANP